MKHALLFILIMALSVIGCAKKNEQVLNAGDITVVSPQPKEVVSPPSKVKVATGEMRDLLLALERVHFQFDASALSMPARNALVEAGMKLLKFPEVALYVDGHTDTRGTTEYNLSLGERRAMTVVDYLSRLGIEKERLQHVSFGEEKTLKQGGGELTHAMNRRVDFRVMEGDVQFVLEEGTLIGDKGNNLIARAD